MKERPILFSAPMVRAILAGTKTMTRRVVGVASSETVSWVVDHPTTPDGRYTGWVRRCDAPLLLPIRCPYGAADDRLWVRETHAFTTGIDDAPLQTPVYRADIPAEHWAEERSVRQTVPGKSPWRPSIHMPRWASRITLELTGVRVERVQEITAEGCIAEGIPSRGIERDGPCIASALMYLADYEKLWDSLNAKRGFGWEANPWCWVLTFRRLAADEGRAVA